MEDYNFYSENIASLVRHRDEILSTPKQYFAQLPFRVNYSLFAGRKPLVDICLVKGPLCLGTLIHAWEKLPQHFVRQKNGKDYLVYWFNGSPLSGCCEFSGVEPETGERISGEPGFGFHSQCKAIEELRDKDDEKLRELLQAEPDFAPWTVREVITFYQAKELR